MKTLQYLQLDPLHMDKKVAHLLPAELAQRFHALPVAVEGARVTVAMAHPDDSIAREGVVRALGPETCIVEADPQIVEALIRELWPDNAQQPLKMLCWSIAQNGTGNFGAYVEDLKNLLGADLRSMTSDQFGIYSLQKLYRAVTNANLDLVILRNPEQPLMKRLILDLVDHRFLDRMPTSMLVVTRELNWPIQKILLVLKNEGQDWAAVDWAVRIARLTKARVAILPQVPVPPLMFADLHQKMNPGSLLASTCPLGKRLRRVTHQLNDHEIQGSLRIRHEPIDQQVRCEILENQYDLIIFGANSQNLIRHWVIGEMDPPPHHWASIPVLLAKPYNGIAACPVV